MSRVPGRVAILLVLVLCASFCLTRLSEVDFHWHLLAGERMLQEHHVPRVDQFSYTSAGRPWIDLQWLFQLIVATVKGRAGWAGLDVLKIGFVVGGFGCATLAALRRGARRTVVAGLGLAAVVASQERFTLRPEAASFLLLGLLLLGLEWGRSRPGSLMLVPPLMVLWANLHALYAVGLAALGAVAAGDLIAWRWPRPAVEGGTGAAPSALLLAAGAALPATLLTPYGLSGWLLPGRLFFERIAADNLYSRSIAEFQAPFGGFGPTMSIRAFALLALIVMGAALLTLKGRRPSDLLLLGGFLSLALLARRNIPLFALAALPAGSPAVDSALHAAESFCERRWASIPWPRVTRRAGTLAGLLIAAAALVLLHDVWTNRFFEHDGTQRYFGRGTAPGFYPEGAADFVQAHRLQGEAFHDMAMGGFLAWRWYPARRTFIDGRLEVHDEAVYTSYLRALTDPKEFEALARRYDARVVLWSHAQSTEAVPLLRHLSSGHGWRPVYIDLSAVVFVREEAGAGREDLPGPVDPRDPALAARLLEEIRQANRGAAEADPAPSFLRRLLPRHDAPVAEVNAALFFGVIGEDRTAETLFREALRVAPGNPVLHYDLGLVLEHAGRVDEARAAYERALRDDPSFAPARSALALDLQRRGDTDGALRQWAIAEQSAPLGAAALQARGALLARRGRVDEAIEDYREAVRAEPDRIDLRLDLALLYHRRGLREQALAEIGRAGSLDPESSAPRVALARIRAAEGDTRGAESIYREVIAREPLQAQAHLGLAALLASGGQEGEALREVTAALAGGLDPAALSAEPGLRSLDRLPEFRKLIAAGRRP